jgi:hypothetical protein
MRKALSALELLTTHLPGIKQALDERWPAFAGQMQAQARLFVDVADENALTESVNQLLRLFILDVTAREIITRPDSTEPTRQPQPMADEETPLQTLANRFYLLCQRPDEFIEQGNLDEFFKRADSDKAGNWARRGPEAKDSGLNKE